MKGRLEAARPRLDSRGTALLAAVCLMFLLSGATAMGQSPAANSLQVNFGEGGGSYSVPLQILLVLTLLTFLPAIFISMTSFTRIIVVAHFLRQALGTQQAPNNQILIGLALFLTMFVMGPVMEVIYRDSLSPYQNGEITQWQALEKATVPLRQFMLKQVREEDLGLFIQLAKLPQPQTEEDLPLRVIVPAFMISELKTAFQIGFILFLPFLIVDMVISSVLLSMGMMQLPPIVISTPFKILLFILVDGWHLIIGSLVESF